MKGSNKYPRRSSADTTKFTQGDFTGMHVAGKSTTVSQGAKGKHPAVRTSPRNFTEKCDVTPKNGSPKK